MLTCSVRLRDEARAGLTLLRFQRVTRERVLMTVHASPNTVKGMRAHDVRQALFGLTLSLALAGCGPAQTDQSESGHRSSTGKDSSASEEQHVDAHEQITTGAVAAIVLEHLGSNTVRGFVTPQSEPGSIPVMVHLAC